MRKLLLLWMLLLSLFLNVPRAAASEQYTLQYIPVKFFIDADVPNWNNTTYLTGYITDLNYVLSKNTDVRLTFHSVTEMINDEEPQANSYSPPLAQTGYELWVSVHKSSIAISHSGWASYDDDYPQASAVAGTYWSNIYNPSNPASLCDYTKQLGIILHEIAHTFKAGIGEYYSMSLVNDNTGVSPNVGININNANDEFWAEHYDWKQDPLQNTIYCSTTKAQILNYMTYSSLTSYTMNNSYRATLPYFSTFTVQYTGLGGAALPNSPVKAWTIQAFGSHVATLVFNGVTDSQGKVTISWGGYPTSHNGYEMLKLLKVYKPGYTPKGKYVSVFDSDTAKNVNGASSHQIVVPLITYQTFADVPNTQYYWQSVESIYSALLTSGCGSGNYCPTGNITRDQMAYMLVRAKYGASYPLPNPIGVFADVPISHWAAKWVEKMYYDGITSGCGGGNFCPSNLVDRSSIAIFLLKYKYGASYVPPAPSHYFIDANGHWAEAWIDQLKRDGITNGCSPNYYCPNANISRADIAVFLQKTFNLP